VAPTLGPPCARDPRPPASTELRALLQSDPFGVAAPAMEAAAGGASTSGVGGADAAHAMGSISKLSPVRASRKAQGCLGANISQVSGARALWRG
jgi:hypothetical protein